ncbi:hypothetical protein L9G15_27725, partial [Shewanella sp. A3A]|nr:hypothetical protein [Shewanella ferrihydritica]
AALVGRRRSLRDVLVQAFPSPPPVEQAAEEMRGVESGRQSEVQAAAPRAPHVGEASAAAWAEAEAP